MGAGKATRTYSLLGAFMNVANESIHDCLAYIATTEPNISSHATRTKWSIQNIKVLLAPHS